MSQNLNYAHPSVPRSPGGARRSAGRSGKRWGFPVCWVLGWLLLWSAGRVAAAPGVDLASPPELSFDSIVKLVFTRNPTVRASREEMEAARHGLDEFRANLSRLEPFVEFRSDLSDFPNRRDAFGNTVETVVGLKKETFEGAVLSTEVGGAYSRYEFGPFMDGSTDVEAGSGALVRTRLEMPFLGSRRRQERIIAQAFQESTARKAQLDYLKNYSGVVDDALEFFNEAVYYQALVEVYDRYASDLAKILADSRLPAGDQARVESVRGSAESSRNLYASRGKEDTEILRSYLALAPGTPLQIRVPEYRVSPFADSADDPAKLAALLDRARENNPAFTVLRDAKNNAELQRQRAINGRYDVTAFLEGTTFPLGSQSFDNRFRGWTAGGGLNVRLNDRRVLKSSQLKAEAEIRQFEAEIEAEELRLRRRITTETRALLDNDRNRTQIMEVIRKKAQEFEGRLQEYFEGKINIDQLVDTRSGLASSETTLASNWYHSANRESRLLLATGKAYELVGLKVKTAASNTLSR